MGIMILRLGPSPLYLQVFLVRESRSKPGAIYIVYKSKTRITHKPITSVVEPGVVRPVYKIEEGKHKFYDILQLVEFHQLNEGDLQTKLTHYVVRSSSPDAPQRSDEEPQPTSSNNINNLSFSSNRSN